MTSSNFKHIGHEPAGPDQILPRLRRLGGNLHLPVYVNRAAAARDSGVAVFLDRDGVLVEDTYFLRSPLELNILPGVVQALHALQESLYVIVVTNQSGIARGLLSDQDLLTIHLELVHQLASQGAYLDALYYCPHLPEAKAAFYRHECDCRKPRPGMLLRAGKDWGIDIGRSFMVGDMPRDIEAGRRVGARGFLIGPRNDAFSKPFETVSDLREAARLILCDVSCPKVERMGGPGRQESSAKSSSGAVASL